MQKTTEHRSSATTFVEGEGGKAVEAIDVWPLPLAHTNGGLCPGKFTFDEWDVLQEPASSHLPLKRISASIPFLSHSTYCPE